LKEPEDREIHLKGAPVSEGIAIGIPIFLSYADETDIPDFTISTAQVDGEIARYRRALSSSREDLKKLQSDLSGEGSKEVASIIGTHIEMLDDPLMTTQVESKIRERLKNTESVFHSVINDFEKRFNETNDSFFNERLSDFKDLSKRVLRNLCDSKKVSLDNIPPNSIVFTKELIPSDTASIQATRISAFVTQSGGGTSHAALIARAKGIPYVASIDLDVLHKAKGKCVIVDGLTGDIILNPTDDTVKKYEKLKNRLTQQYQQLEKDRDLLAETIDGYPICLYANVNTLSDIDLVLHHGAHGIGLFRSEYLFMQDPTLFQDEDRQYLIYQQMLKRSKGLPFTFRALDFGGDKGSDLFEELSQEPNPVLGCRGIRFLLRRKDIFKTQLRALLRAGAGSELRILFPMISDIHELREVKRLIEEVKAELTSRNVPHNFQPALGCMMEVPSAVMICDALAQESDFLALGTNDLIQYTLGIDRSNPGMSDFYYPTHPGIIRMIKMTILEAKRYQKPITICGEIASNPLFTPLLIGLGVQNFSCAPRFLPIIKRTVRHLSLLDCCDIAEEVLSKKTSAEIAAFLAECLHGAEIEFQKDI
jgi:phosphoenolpyruvate-protein phosphotransferase (PTS system enzyme I)